MQYRLRHGLSYCRVGGHLIFLDVPNDRYFQLSRGMEDRFLAHARGDDAHVDVSALVDQGILTASRAESPRRPEPRFIPPVFSALERSEPKHHAGLSCSLAVLTTVFSIQLELRALGLVGVLDKLVAYRQRRTTHQSSTTTPQDGQRLLDSTSSFQGARLYVPVPTRCLLDSLALVRFLARQRLHAHIVFGVTADPFSAHCWVQSRDLVLNDTVGHVNTLTPIRIV